LDAHFIHRAPKPTLKGLLSASFSTRSGGGAALNGAGAAEGVVAHLGGDGRALLARRRTIAQALLRCSLLASGGIMCADCKAASSPRNRSRTNSCSSCFVIRRTSYQFSS